MDLERECDVPFKSYTWKVLGTHVLGGNLEGPDLENCPQWIWARLTSSLGIQTRDHVILKRNEKVFASELEKAEAPGLPITRLFLFFLVALHMWVS